MSQANIRINVFFFYPIDSLGLECASPFRRLVAWAALLSLEPLGEISQGVMTQLEKSLPN